MFSTKKPSVKCVHNHWGLLTCIRKSGVFYLLKKIVVDSGTSDLRSKAQLQLLSYVLNE